MFTYSKGVHSYRYVLPSNSFVIWSSISPDRWEVGTWSTLHLASNTLFYAYQGYTCGSVIEAKRKLETFGNLSFHLVALQVPFLTTWVTWIHSTMTICMARWKRVRCTHWLEEVPVWVYTCWVCKPVKGTGYYIKYSGKNGTMANVSIFCGDFLA